MVFTLNELKVLPGDYTLTWMGLEYFRRALTENAEFIPLLLSSLRSLASDIPVILIFSLFMAVLLNQNFRGRTFVRAVFFIPVVLVTGVVANTAYETGLNDILSSQNLGDAANQATQMTAGVESLLLSLNFGEGLLSFVSAAVTGISRVVQSSGVQIFLFLAALQEIPSPCTRRPGWKAAPNGRPSGKSPCPCWHRRSWWWRFIPLSICFPRAIRPCSSTWTAWPFPSSNIPTRPPCTGCIRPPWGLPSRWSA